MLGDLHTPVRTYLKVRDIFPQSALMESSDYHGSENNRSFIGLCPVASVSIDHAVAVFCLPDGTREEHPVTEEYHAENLAGKKAVFAVKVNGIQVKELPTLDDEFAKDVSEYDTLEALRDAKRQELLEQAEKNAKIQKENDVVRKAVENATVEVPDAMVERQIDSFLQDMGYRLQMQGISLEDYLKYTNTEISALRDQYRADAALRVKSQLVLEAISKAEAIEATPEEIGDKVAEYAKQFGNMTVEDFEKNLQADDRQYFADQVVVEKTLALLVENAKEVAPKKKATRKKKAAAEAEAPAEQEAPAAEPQE